MISAFTGAVLVGVLTATISAALTSANGLPSPSGRGAGGEGGRSKLLVSIADSPHPGSLPEGEGDRHAAVTAPPYGVARLGAELFTRYLLAVEAAGILLFAALVGAAVIVSQGRAAMKRRNPPGGLSRFSRPNSVPPTGETSSAVKMGLSPLPPGGTIHA